MVVGNAYKIRGKENPLEFFIYRGVFDIHYLGGFRKDEFHCIYPHFAEKGNGLFLTKLQGQSVWVQLPLDDEIIEDLGAFKDYVAKLKESNKI